MSWFGAWFGEQIQYIVAEIDVRLASEGLGATMVTTGTVSGGGTRVRVDLSAPTNLTLTLRAACYGSLAVTLTRDGEALDIADASIRYVANLTTPLIKTVDDGITITDGAGGVFLIEWEVTDTFGQNSDQKVAHECRIQLLAEGPLPIFEGQMNLEQSLFVAV